MQETLTSISYPYRDHDKILVNPAMSIEPLTTALARDLYHKIEADRSFLQQWLPNFADLTQNQLLQEVEAINLKRAEHAIYAIRVNNNIVGCLETYPHNPQRFSSDHTCYFVNFYLLSAEQGKGYLREALSSFTALLYTEAQVSRFEFHVHQANERALNVLHALGAQQEGLLRNLHGCNDYLLYSYVLPEDYLANNNVMVEEIDATDDTEQMPVSALPRFHAPKHKRTLSNLNAESSDSLESTDVELEMSADGRVVVTNPEEIDSATYAEFDITGEYDTSAPPASAEPTSETVAHPDAEFSEPTDATDSAGRDAAVDLEADAQATKTN